MQRTNNLPLRNGFSVQKLLTNKSGRAFGIVRRNKKDLARVVKNNEWLLGKVGITLSEQQRRISKSGFYLGRQSYSAIKNGKDYFCSYLVCWLLADFWDLDGQTLSSIDMEGMSEDELREVGVVLRNPFYFDGSDITKVGRPKKK